MGFRMSQEEPLIPSMHEDVEEAVRGCHIARAIALAEDAPVIHEGQSFREVHVKTVDVPTDPRRLPTRCGDDVDALAERLPSPIILEILQRRIDQTALSRSVRVVVSGPLVRDQTSKHCVRAI